MEVEPSLNINLDAARGLQKSLHDAPLRIVGDRDKFKSHRLEGAEEWEGASADDSLKDPAFVANDVAAQIVSKLSTPNRCLALIQLVCVVFPTETQVPISRTKRKGQIHQDHCQ